MTFQDVARKIVANSIKSAICIDDQYVEPYKEVKGKASETDKPRKLTESFRKSNCSLDIYTFRSYRQLRKDSGFVFNNRDLLILDWELTKDPVSFKDALLILNNAAINSSLTFILIYTREKNLAGIEMQIRSFYNNRFNNPYEREKTYAELMAKMDEEFFLNPEIETIYDDAERFFSSSVFRDPFKELIMEKPSDKSFSKFRDQIIAIFEDKSAGRTFLKLFDSYLKDLYKCDNLFDCCEQLEFRNQNTYIDETTKGNGIYCHKIEGQENALWVNNTYITISYKGDLQPDSVYDNFSSQLCSRPGNIMTLIALEMRNHFIENSGKVGKDLLAIDERAFFYPYLKENYRMGKEEFYDFLKNNWKHQVASFHLNSGSEVFSALDEYVLINRLEEAVRTNPVNELQEEIGKLNHQYSFHHAGRKEKDHLRFGDIFNFKETDPDGDVVRYLINITAHCDCLRPGKVKNNYHFVMGNECKLKNGLKNATKEDQSYSFLYRNGDIVCISWEDKPFTIFIPEDKRFFHQKKPVRIKIGDKIKYLYYEGKLLENYTQKIANKAFASAARVGIDLVQL